MSMCRNFKRPFTYIAGVVSVALAFVCLGICQPAYAEDTGTLTVSTEGPTSEEIDEVLSALDTNNAGISLYSAGPRAATAASEQYSGADRLDVSYAVARAAFPNGVASKKAILVGREAWADALSATSLAGVLDCPIILVNAGGLSTAAQTLLRDLGVKSVVIVGGTGSLSANAERTLSSMGISSERIQGADRYEVSLGVYQYGAASWKGGMVLVASGTGFADALSLSPLAFSQKAPIILTRGSSGLSAGQKQALEAAARSGSFKTCVIAGGPASVPNAVESYMRGIVTTSAGGQGVVRHGGSNRYAVSASLASWEVNKGYLSWNRAGLASGTAPFDALSGSVMQGKRKSVLLLCNGNMTSPTITSLINSSATSVTFFGGPASISNSIRSYVVSNLGVGNSYEAKVSLLSFASLQSSINGKYSTDAFLEYMDPGRVAYGSGAYYQFANISGFTGRVSAQQINDFLSATCSANGYTSSVLLGKGDAIIKAARDANINEVYLLSHAILESGWGMSALAQGRVAGYEGYYNLFGIGAYDIDPNNGGAALAKAKGWNTVDKALEGAAQWIASNYTYGTYQQNTLYKMRWNLVNGKPSHQYATDPAWASSIAGIMGRFYERAGLSLTETGTTFLVPAYQ